MIRVAVSFPVSGSVSCIKLEYPSLVVCGHFDGTLSAHQVEELLELEQLTTINKQIKRQADK